MNVPDFLLRSIPMLLQFYADFFLKTDFEKTMIELESEYNVPKIKTYDFVIVGGGSAGCVLAGRLSEYFDVLLLEAGGDPPPATVVPYYTPAVVRDPSIREVFRTVPQTNAVNKIFDVTAGKVLGGSASLNAMIYSRGSPKDFDNWASILNDESFNYTNVLRYFKKMETFVGEKFGTEGDEYYGNDGPIVVKTNVIPLLDVWLQAGRELGYQTFDPNGFQQEGFAPLNLAARRGQRSSSYAEYIRPYEESRSNLTVIRYATVSEILLDNVNKAYGVAYTRHGFPQIVHARNEIILSAGTFSSPLLLMKSGIGPESVLNAAEIPVKVPLEAVGKNLHDHVAFGIRFRANDSSLFPNMDPSNTMNVSEEYQNGEGLLTTHSAGLAENEHGVLTVSSLGASGFIVSSKAETGWPDLWIQLQTNVSLDGREHGISLYSINGLPRSRGLLTLNTENYKAGIRDATQLTLIDYNFLTHPDDVDVLLDGVKLIFRIVETDAFKSVNLSYAYEPDPLCSDFTYLSDDYWKCIARQVAFPWTHMVGTCSLGPDSADSTTSVVDTKFRVRGVSSLRVVDASVIPVITNTNINAPVMMLAEKAAEDIINFYRASDTTNDIPPTTNTPPTAPHIEDGTIPSKCTTVLINTNTLFLVSIFSFACKYYFIQ